MTIDLYEGAKKDFLVCFEPPQYATFEPVDQQLLDEEFDPVRTDCATFTFLGGGFMKMEILTEFEYGHGEDIEFYAIKEETDPGKLRRGSDPPSVDLW